LSSFLAYDNIILKLAYLPPFFKKGGMMMSQSNKNKNLRLKKFVIFLFSFVLTFLVPIIYRFFFEEGTNDQKIELIYFFILSLLLVLVILTYREFLLAGETSKNYLIIFISVCLVLYLVEILNLTLSFLIGGYDNIGLFRTLRFNSFLWFVCTILYVKNYLVQHKK
jgi:membrane protein